jgi:SAM-dependent methyltransferase
MKNNYSKSWFEMFLQTIKPAQTELEVAFISHYLPQPTYKTILDVCCGFGRHAYLLAERGYRVTGIDSNPEAIAKARSLSGGEVVYLQEDMRNLDKLTDTFDSAINLWQSFGYFDETTNADILGQISKKLNPKGRMILDIYHRRFFGEHQGIRSFKKGNLAITEKKSMDGNRLTVQLDYGPGYESDLFEWQLYTPDEICRLVEDLGFVCLAICTDFDEKRPASASSPRMQIVFEKR